MGHLYHGKLLVITRGYLALHSSAINQWIELREILQENPMIFMGKSMGSCRCSLKPIH